MAHVIRENKALLSRVRRIKGQVAALESALLDHAECSVVLQQTSAVRGAITALMLELMNGHLREHVAGGKPSGAKRDKELDQVMRLLKTYIR